VPFPNSPESDDRLIDRVPVIIALVTNQIGYLATDELTLRLIKNVKNDENSKIYVRIPERLIKLVVIRTR